MKVSKFELFRNEVIENSLYIVMYEDGSNAYIFGCRCVDIKCIEIHTKIVLSLCTSNV